MALSNAGNQQCRKQTWFNPRLVEGGAMPAFSFSDAA
jgi:hypothetical protein